MIDFKLSNVKHEVNYGSYMDIKFRLTPEMVQDLGLNTDKVKKIMLEDFGYFLDLINEDNNNAKTNN